MSNVQKMLDILFFVFSNLSMTAACTMKIQGICLCIPRKAELIFRQLVFHIPVCHHLTEIGCIWTDLRCVFRSMFHLDYNFIFLPGPILSLTSFFYIRVFAENNLKGKRLQEIPHLKHFDDNCDNISTYSHGYTFETKGLRICILDSLLFLGEIQ